jgi:hypothetical protein
MPWSVLRGDRIRWAGAGVWRARAKLMELTPSRRPILQNAFPPKHQRSRDEVTEVYNTPLMELVYHAATVHRMYNDPSMVRRQKPSPSSRARRRCRFARARRALSLRPGLGTRPFAVPSPLTPSDPSHVLHTYTPSNTKTHKNKPKKPNKKTHNNRSSAARSCRSRRAAAPRTAATAASRPSGPSRRGPRPRS